MTRKSIDVVTWLKNWFESKSNKVTSLSASSTDTQYPSAKAVYDEIQNNANSGGCVEDYYFDTTTKEIIIDYVCGSGGGSSGSGGSVTIDDSWITDSTNPVQSKIIKLALDGKAASDHTHTKSQITDFPTVPTASTTVPNADAASGSYGSGTVYARSNHVHPKSSLYAEASHTHSAYVNPTIADNLITNDSSQVLSAKQGKVLKEYVDTLVGNIEEDMLS